MNRHAIHIENSVAPPTYPQERKKEKKIKKK